MTVDDETRKRHRGGDEREEPRVHGSSGADDEAIEIVDVTATDEAGTPLEDEGPVLEIDDEPEDEPPPQREEPRREDDERLRAAEARVAELKEHLVRTVADFENFRKRTERDRVEERKQAAQGLVRSLLPVVDNFERAVRQADQAAGEGPAAAAFVEGVRLISGQLLDTLRAAGLEPVDATGPFDPNVHEALLQEATTEAPHMAVTEVFEPGWKLHGRLLRPAKVKVAVNPTGAAPAESEA